METKTDGRIIANKRRCKITDEQILADIRDGYTRQQIADRHGVHVENLARRMHKLGVHATYAKNLGGTPRKIFGECWHYVKSQDKRIAEDFQGFEYLESRRLSSGPGYMRLRCRTCGAIIETQMGAIREHTLTCRTCKEKERQKVELYQKRVELTRFFIALEQSKIEKKCKICGEVFFSANPNKIYCSNKCKRASHAMRRSHRYKNRCEKYGAFFDKTITLEGVIKRDKNVCKICGEPCDRSSKDWGNIGSMYPTIDHIVPLAKGGTHTWDNVQLAHALCNSTKRDLLTVKTERRSERD